MTIWKKLNMARLNKVKPNGVNKISAQDHTVKPLLLGVDVVAWYPSIDAIACAELVFEAVMDSKIEFQGNVYNWLSVYLLLTLVEDTLYEYGLREIVPERANKKSTASSLCAQSNRDMKSWRTFGNRLNAEMKRTMLALMMKTAVLVMMKSTCYTFGGLIFKQRNGTGIGLRGSACVACR